MIDPTRPATGVVVGVDGPRIARVVAWAAREADRRHLALDLVHVLPPSERDLAPRSPSGEALALLDHARRVATIAAPGPEVRLSVVDGVPGPALADIARQAEMLVVGSRAASSVIQPAVGRTIAHVLAHAPCPVAIVGPGDDVEDGDGGAVVVGVDGSPEARGAVAFAADAADRRGAALAALAVVAPLGADGDENSQHRYLAEAVAGTATAHPDVLLQELVARGVPGQELVRAARGARLLVVGSRGHGLVAGALLGSTSQAVVRLARCPVVVLPPRPARRWADLEHARSGRAS